VDALLFELSMIRCTKELKEEASAAAERRKLREEKYLTTLYKEFREGIPDREPYRIVLAEVRDTLLVTKVLPQPNGGGGGGGDHRATITHARPQPDSGGWRTGSWASR